MAVCSSPDVLRNGWYQLAPCFGGVFRFKLLCLLIVVSDQSVVIYINYYAVNRLRFQSGDNLAK